MTEPKDYVVIDLEMTGLSPKQHKVIEIGALRVRDGKEVAALELLVNPKCVIPEKVVALTGITDTMVAEGLEEDAAMSRLLEFIGEDILVGHNLVFDYSFLKQWEINHKIKKERRGCDTLKIARALLPVEQSKKLEELTTFFGICHQRGHRALDDARATGILLERFKEMAPAEEKNQKLFEAKPLIYHAKKQTPATARQIERLRNYCVLHKIEDPICYENLTRSEASRLMDRYLAKYEG